MSHTTTFLLSSPLPYRTATCLSSLPTFRASLERKKGFGPPQTHKEKGPSKQLQESLQGASAEGKKAILLHNDSRELQSVVKSVEQDMSKKRTRQLNIDREVAAKGKVDFVKVESWGSEGKDQRDVDNLKVKSFSPSFSSRDTTGSFYERLVHRIQLLESKGEISVVHAKTLPPFQDWNFGEERYLQYLVDQLAVFDALRTSIAPISEQESKSTLFNEDKFAAAVKIFDESLGLERSEALQDDIKTFSKAMGAVHKKIFEVPKPTTQTTAYVKYLRQLAGVSGSTKPGKEGYLQLLSHIFVVYVTHLTTGIRIGAKALDCVSLLKHSKAVRFYRFYPQNIRDPLKVLIQAINRVAYLIPADEDQEMVMEELPKAIQKTSLLLAILAVREKQ
ncbi:hypothetical protein GOP47_0001975 [Adiantum capillus-veneris]|uniref:heme oxygenase (biliverdin-producing) n=1 Tax=Adiantum capillus-veneris TaxID=13818 RepID=A0A9D4V9U4_ADICA|nr:hypothetical protein GOP47_0001975 [Adiantum capillus-veneris]